MSKIGSLLSSRSVCIILALLASSVVIGYSGSDPPPPAEPTDSESAALGMYLKIRAPMKLFKSQPHLVLFARLGEGEGIEDLDRKSELIPSTFVSGYHVYLLDVPPGTYVAVATVHWKENPPDTIRVASVNFGPLTFEYYLEFLYEPDAFRYYFSKQLIEETKVTIEPGSFVFVGEFVADSTTKVKKADEVQRHLMQMIEGERANKSKFTKGFMYGEYSYLLAPHETDRSKGAEIQFFTKATKHLEESTWAGVIDERLENR